MMKRLATLALAVSSILPIATTSRIAEAAPAGCYPKSWSTGASVRCIYGPDAWKAVVGCRRGGFTYYTVSGGWKNYDSYPSSSNAACTPGDAKTSTGFSYDY